MHTLGGEHIFTMRMRSGTMEGQKVPVSKKKEGMQGRHDKVVSELPQWGALVCSEEGKA